MLVEGGGAKAMYYNLHHSVPTRPTRPIRPIRPTRPTRLIRTIRTIRTLSNVYTERSPAHARTFTIQLFVVHVLVFVVIILVRTVEPSPGRNFTVDRIRNIVELLEETDPKFDSTLRRYVGGGCLCFVSTIFDTKYAQLSDVFENVGRRIYVLPVGPNLGRSETVLVFCGVAQHDAPNG